MSQEKIYLIGTDIGTSGTKSLVVDNHGNIISSDYVEYGVIIPRSLWAEQWPGVWFEAVCKTIRNSLNKAQIPVNKVAGVTISGLYGGSGIPCNKNMEPIRPCIIWMDRRATEEVEWVRKNIGEENIFKITSNYVDSYYGFTKILWIKNKEPEVWKKVKFLVTPNAYAIYMLTGSLSMDLCSAGNIGGIFDIRKKDWSEELLAEMGIPRDFFQEKLVESSEIVGYINSNGSKMTGLLEGTPVCAGGIDCVVATFGTGAFNEGDHVGIIGTSSSWGIIHNGKMFHPSLISMPYVIDSRKKVYSFAGSATSGALIKWFREQFGKVEKKLCDFIDISSYSLMDLQANNIMPGSEKLIVLPYFMGERAPIWDVNARGTIFGLTLYHKKAHIYRALLESVAYSLRTCIENGKKLEMRLNKNMIMSGGAIKSSLWKQIFADVTQFPITCVLGDGEAPYGGALLAAIGTGIINDLNKIKKWIRYESPVAVNRREARIYEEYFFQYKSLYSALKRSMADISKLT